jgi:hypothetical protein
MYFQGVGGYLREDMREMMPELECVWGETETGEVDCAKIGVFADVDGAVEDTWRII